MLKTCVVYDCTQAQNKCEACAHKKQCDYVWIAEIWKKNSKLLTPLNPGWLKPDMRAGHIVSVTGAHDFCVFNAPKRKDTITIQDICVDEAVRGQGISKKILADLMETYDRDIIAKCIKGSSADKFWSHIGEKLGEEPSKKTTLCIYRVINNNKSYSKVELF